MKTFMLVAMLLGLLVTMWLVARSLQEQTTSVPGAAVVVKPIERSAEMRRTVEAADKLKEKNLDDAARDK
jgi:hypothetical protein